MSSRLSGHRMSKETKKSKVKYTRGIKIVAVGPIGSGRTCLLHVYTTNEFPVGHSPTVFDNYGCSVMVENEATQLTLFDCSGSEDYSHLRPLTYTGVDLFLLMFSVIDREGLRKVETYWVPELKKYNPHIPVLLVGGKTDLREEASVLRQLAAEGLKPVAAPEGKAVAQRIHACGYVECSSLLQDGVHQVFATAITTCVEVRRKENNSGKKSRKRCLIL